MQIARTPPGRTLAVCVVTGAAMGVGTSVPVTAAALLLLCVAVTLIVSGPRRRSRVHAALALAALAAGLLRGAGALPPPATLPAPHSLLAPGLVVRGAIDGIVDDAVRPRRDALGRRSWIVPLRLADGARARVLVADDAGDRLAEERAADAPARWRSPAHLLPGDALTARGTFTTPRAAANPGEPDRRVRDRRSGVTLLVRASHPAAIQRAAAPPDRGTMTSALRRVGARLRAAALERLAAACAGDRTAEGLAACLLVGERAGVARDTEDTIRRAGAAHLLVVSGLHVVLLVGAASTLLRRLASIALPGRTGRIAALVASLALLVAYAAACRLATPVLRSGVFVAVALIARACGRRTGTADHLAAAAAIVTAFDPTQVLSPGFHLSFAAVGGLCFLGPRFREALFAEWDLLARFPEALPPWRLRLMRAVTIGVSASLGASTATAPVAAWTFGEVHPAAVLSNALAVPIVGVLLPLIAVSTATGGWAAWLTSPLLGLGTRLLRTALEPVAALPGATVPATPSGAQVAVSLVAIAIGCQLRPWRRRHLVIALIAWAVLLPGGSAGPGSSGSPAVAALDVGHGLAVLVRGGRGGDLLFDAGARRPGAAEHVILPALRAVGVRRLAALAISHEDSDHCGAVADVLDGLPVGEILVPPGFGGDPAGRAVLAAARRHAIPVTTLSRGDTWRRRDLDVVTILPFAGRPGPVQNDGSLVLHVTAGDARAPPGARVTALLPGDLDDPALVALAADATLPRADVLVLPHHGRGDPAPQEALARRLGARVLIASTPSSVPMLVRGALVTGRDGAVWVTPRGAVLRRGLPDP